MKKKNKTLSAIFLGITAFFMSPADEILLAGTALILQQPMDNSSDSRYLNSVLDFGLEEKEKVIYFLFPLLVVTNYSKVYRLNHSTAPIFLLGPWKLGLKS